MLWHYQSRDCSSLIIQIHNIILYPLNILNFIGTLYYDYVLCSGGSDGGRLHGSPADYVWGPQGVDNIISQMLASLEDPGPPPAEKEKIESLPTVEATEDSLKDCESV